MATGILRSSASRCCWCGEGLVEVASTPGIWWCLTPACYQKQLQWGISRNEQTWSRNKEGQNVLTNRWERLFVPLPRQVDYMAHPATYRLSGGAAGFGKSTAARRLLERKCLEIAGYEGLLVRETFPELERTHLRRMASEAEAIGADFIESKRLMKFPNGSLIECGHMDDEKALRRYLSTEYDHIIADEGSSFDPKQLLELSTRARTSKPAVLAAGGAKFDVVSNPGGRAAKMLKDLFIDHVVDADEYPILATSDEQGRPFYEPAQWAYIPATLDDNPYIDPAYVRSLAVLQPWRYEQLRRGDWNVFAGAFFSSWSSGTHVREVKIADPQHATFLRALDWGFHDPCVIGWFAVLPDGHYHCVAELKLKEHLIVDVVREVKAMDRTLGLPSPVRATRTYADPAVRQRGGQTGESILETFGKAGMPLIPSVNERVNGWMRVQALLRPAEDGIPFLTFDPACKYLTRSMGGAMSDEKNPDDLVQHDDHGLDMIRYFAMSRPMPRSVAATPRPGDGTAGHLMDEALRASVAA
jgi:phage terminase large subunit